jgi:PilZ domain
MRAPYVYLASKTEQENQILRHKLEPLTKEFRNLHFLSVHHRGLIASLEQPPALVVLNHLEFTVRQQIELDQLREAGYLGQVLVLAKPPTADILSDFQDRDNVVFLEKPFENRDFDGMVRKILNAREVSQRIHRRYNTAQEVAIEAFGKNMSYTSRVCNLSVGGAYLEFISPPAIAEGELVRLTFDLSEMNRTYTMPARVVWQKKAADRVGVALGVEFIGPGDVKKTLLRL